MLTKMTIKRKIRRKLIVQTKNYSKKMSCFPNKMYRNPLAILLNCISLISSQYERDVILLSLLACSTVYPQQLAHCQELRNEHQKENCTKIPQCSCWFNYKKGKSEMVSIRSCHFYEHIRALMHFVHFLSKKWE